ncbi:MAG: putative transcriptional regulator [Candidatus Saccharibacteria bacterium GW2011_GWC2_48_9]|nr:MAG: putative transcriptional regulator [Candidatus Saccharibacteria bacterium GW2011_GWC2_48_9]HCH34493.1 transcriptional regulator [Candidatus Saccharibacteria bacterium]
MIDALFGSKTRVKLLHLFLNNPGKSFYVREITRLIDEQINSVRRELSNMMGIGIITSKNDDNKLYYEINQRYEYYVPLRAIFADEQVETKAAAVAGSSKSWTDDFAQLPGVRLVVTAGVLVRGSASAIDVLLVGDVPAAKLKAAVKAAEKVEGRELNYTSMPYEEFYYRLSVRDKFVTEIINGKHAVLVDTDKLLSI